jgi:hypothetical protein
MSTKANVRQYTDTTETNERDRNFRKGKGGSQQRHASLYSYISGKGKWQKNQVHVRVYIPLTTEIWFMLKRQQSEITHMK